LIAEVAFQVDLNSIPLNTGGSFEKLLTFVNTNSSLFNGWYASWALGALFAIPALLALYVVLSRAERGFTLIGTAVGVVAIVIILSNVSNHFYYVSEANVYDGGCTVCATQSITGALATFASYTADQLASLIFVVAVIILSLVILRVGILNKSVGIVGLVAAVLAIVITVAGASGYLDIIGLLPYVAVAVWLIMVGYSLTRLPVRS